MNKYILGIDGMKCGMCEAHVSRAIRNNIKIKKINASHFKNQVEVITELDLSVDVFKKILDPLGYYVIGFTKSEATKSLLGWK